MEILNGQINHSDISKNSKGGTEMMVQRLLDSMPNKAIFDPFQIIVSRFTTNPNPDKIRLYWAHDLAGDPMSKPLENGGWKQFHKLIFVSYWQRNEFMRHYGIPHSQTAVLRNSINPIEPKRSQQNDKIRLIYHTTPHRGLDVLYAAFNHLAKENPRLHLDVFSSFEIYGWKDRDNQYKQVFDLLDVHPQITNHGTVPNDVVREYLAKADIFAYPSTWPETSCISLIEAMSAGCLCVHPDFAALPETSANWTLMYPTQDVAQAHVNEFASALGAAIKLVETPEMQKRLEWQRQYTNLFYSQEVRALEWTRLLDVLKDADPKISFTEIEQPIVFRT